MRQQHLGEHQVAVGIGARIRLHFHQAAFEGHGHTLDPGRLHPQRRLAGDATVIELTDAMGQPGRTGIHRLGLAEGHQLDHQLASLLHIA
ncbi:hypothetical protein D3C85_1370000 [compost metagenome]